MAVIWRVVLSDFLRSVCRFRSKKIAFKDSLQGGCAMISTSLSHYKSGPKTVGVPAWAKAAQRRRRSVVRLDKPKTIEQIQAEYRVANDPTELSINTTTRLRPLKNESSRESTLEKPEISVSEDGSMFVCYHPAKPYPLQYSKSLSYYATVLYFGELLLWEFCQTAQTKAWWHLGSETTEGFRDSLTDEEIKEARMLRNKDPKLWTVNTLSQLFKVKPLAVMIAAPLNEKQKREVEVERQVLHQWSEYRRKEYRANQEMERQRYIEDTRGSHMRKKLGIK